jgi:nucleoside-diphosphate-sugar epimerase
VDEGEVLTQVLRADLYDIVSDSNIPWSELQDSTMLVTGATGLVGGALIRALAAANAQYQLHLRLLAHGRNQNRGAVLAAECGVEFVDGDIRKAYAVADITDEINYVIHGAALTKSSEMVAQPVEVMATAVDGTRNILNSARDWNCESLVYLSSMEIYGQTELTEVGESDLGYLDLTAPRSSYPESKRFCESLCATYAAQYGVPVKIARLAQTFGAGTPPDDTRVFAQFARSAAAGENIVLHTAGTSRGNYCYISDTVRGLLTILLKGKNGDAYNIANPDASGTIREMAELVANEVCGGKIKVVINVPKDLPMRGYAPEVGYTLNADKLKALGWEPKFGLAEMYQRILADWQGR